MVREDQAAVVREAAERIASGEAKTAIIRDFNRRGIWTAAKCVNLHRSTFEKHVTALVIERLSRPDAAELFSGEGHADAAREAMAEAAEKRARVSGRGTYVAEQKPDQAPEESAPST
ncbi:hypothetical protein [Streptomyces pacificus]|uniref:Uncharacterized protein n=1 Tax=Streptomyces pacificus TaxID=2705029 RepID=A0A6A0AWX3_9ACTN|nr:hypothetical protein [Streptomyces pacificus]GFH36841.1 hypothetical protein SCWH03_30740 [Streptomyces pacificus]